MAGASEWSDSVTCNRAKGIAEVHHEREDRSDMPGADGLGRKESAPAPSSAGTPCSNNHRQFSPKRRIKKPVSLGIFEVESRKTETKENEERRGMVYRSINALENRCFCLRIFRHSPDAGS
jgi:hypothetical protein